MARVSMEIRAARNEQIEGGRLRAIVRLDGGVVIGMTGLERVEPRGRERGDQRVALRDAGVRQRRKAAARVNDADHGLGGGAPPRDEGRPAEFEKTGEGLVPRRDVPGVHHRRRDLRPPHAATRGRIFEYRGNVNRVPERGKAIAHLSNAATPLLPLAVEEIAQGRAGRVDEVSEDVDVTSVRDGGFYGWPFSYYGEHLDVRAQPQRPDLVERAIVPDFALGPHTASLGLAWSGSSSLPSRFNGGMFVGQHGSWNRKPRSGYKVIFVPFARGMPAGDPIDVLTGFVRESGDAMGRPVGVAIDKTGALLVADDIGNVVWRVSRAQSR